jgi:hypothetical protein
MIRKQLFVSLMVVFCLMIASDAFAWERSSSSVPPDSSYYRELDKLVAFGLIVPPIRGQRPYPRSEFARMTAEAIANIEKHESESDRSLDSYVKYRKRKWQIDISVDRLKEEFREELIDMGAMDGGVMTFRLHPLEKLYIYNRYLNSPPTQLPRSNGRGGLDAIVNPLGDYNLGRHPIDGGTSAYEPVARFQATKFWSAYVRPRFEVDLFRTGDMQGHAYLQNLYTTFRAGNFSLKVGRDSMAWGFGDRGSLLFSTNPRPLDGFWLTNPKPARLPWVFKHLGRWRYTLYATNLGPGYSQKWAWLTGYKLSLAPAKYVELGLGHAVMIGGEGTPAPSAVDVVGEFIGFRPTGTDPLNPNLVNFSNHMFEAEMMVRIPQLRGTEIYGSFALEDKWKSITKTLRHGMSYMGGIYLPAINSSGSLDLRAEYIWTCPLQYRHGMYNAGYTLNRKLIGSDAGPDANTLHVLLRHTLSKDLWYGLTVDWDYRSSDTWTETTQPNGLAGDIVKVASGPTEERFRGVFDVSWRMRKNLKLNFSTGYERVLNLSFVDGNDRNNYLVALSVAIDLDRFFSYSGK